MTATTVRRWVRVCSLRDLEPGRGVAALVDGHQVAVFLLPAAGGGGGGVGGAATGGGEHGGGEPAAHLRAVDNRDPVSGANVLARGLLGSADGTDYVASPMLKHRFDLTSGRCLDGVSPGVRVWPVRVWGTTVEVLSVTGSGPPEAAPGEDGSPTATGDGPAPGTGTHCPFCALQCALRVRPGADGIEVAAEPDFPVNAGRLCIKGLNAGRLVGHPERITTPLVRDASGRLVPTDWDTALDRLAGRLTAIAAAHGPDAIGVFGSGALTNEKAYLLGKFARVALGTASIDYNGRWCMASAAAAANRVLGVDRGLPFPVSDIGDTDTLVLWGANPADTMPPLMHWVERMRSRGGRLVVVDPRRSATAAAADEHLQPVPGSDLAVALGLLHLAATKGLVDEGYVAGRTTGWDGLRRSVEEWTPERVRAHSGLTPAQLAGLLDALAGRPASMLLTGRGPEQQTTGTDTVTALISLMVVLGRVGRPASGYGCLTGQANGQGGREHGQKADQLPGYRLIALPEDRAAVAAVWGIDPDALPGPGRSATEMLAGAGLEGGIRALILAGSNPAVAAPDAGRAGAALGRLECLVVLDAFHSESTAGADFVLPVMQWAEEDGTVTSLEGRVLRRRRATEPPPGVRSDIDILCDLAGRLGRGRYFSYESVPGCGRAPAVFDEMARASAGGRADYSGISYDRLDAGEPLYWPCPSGGHPGTPRLFADHFAHPDGRAHLAPLEFRPPAESPDSEYPVWYSTGREREHYNSGAQTRLIDRLRAARPAPRLRVHPDLAAATGLADGGEAYVVSRRGRARFSVEVTGDVRPDTVFAPFHWGGPQSANAVTNPALDPASRMPEFKVCAVRLEPVPEPVPAQVAPTGG